jgi:hypothetical protein
MRGPGRVGTFAITTLDSVLTALSGAAGGLLLVQFPQFLAQYLQRLGGHIDEASLSAAKFRLPELAARAQELKAGLDAISDAPVLWKLPSFLYHAQWDIAKAAYKNFTPGMTFNDAGLLYFISGLVVGLVLYGALKALGKKILAPVFAGKTARARGAD